MNKSASISSVKSKAESVKKLVKTMTAIAWVVLSIGVLLCAFNLYDFNDRNTGLMIGIGFLIGSVHIYVIGTAIGLVQARLSQAEDANNERDPQ